MAKKKEIGTGFSAELQEAIDALNASYGEGSLGLINRSPNMEAETVSTGSLILDRALGGGYAKGRLIEIYGLESTGKSTLAWHFLKQFGGNKVYIDTEQALSKELGERIGVHMDNLLISQPSCLEEGLDIMLKLCNNVDAMVLDSVAAAPPKKDTEGDVTSQNISLKARVLSKTIPVLVGENNSHSTILFVNQVRTDPSIQYGSNRVVPGGWTLKFFCHIRLDIYAKEIIKGKDDVAIGHLMKIKVVKNRSGVPHVKCEVPIIYDGYGVSTEMEILTLGAELGVIEKSGAFYKHKGTVLGQGLENSRLFLKDNIEYRDQLEKEIKDKLSQ